MSGINKYKVLLVEDEESIINTLRRVLQKKGFSEIVSALNARQGIKFIESTETAFSLIISDLNMPGMKGDEFLGETLRLSPVSRRILITENTDFSSVVNAINLGAIHQYIIKPIDIDDFLTKISSELQIYDRHRQKQKLISITKHQNFRLFNFAKQLKQKNKKFIREIKLKQEEKSSLENALMEIKASSDKNKNLIGLNNLLTRNIMIKQDSLLKAFNIIKDQTDSFFRTISENNGIKFPFKSNQEEYVKNENYDKVQYEIIDHIIGYIGRKAEPLIHKIESDESHKNEKKFSIDDYETVPNTGELAFQKGYITEEDLNRVRIKRKVTQEGQSPDISIEKCLMDLNMITRVELSRLLVEKKLIEIRLKDREFAAELIKRHAVSPEKIEQAFVKQLNLFEQESDCLALGDILVDEGTISPDLRDELFRAHNRTDDMTKNTGVSSLLSPSMTDALIDLQISADKTRAFIRIAKSLHGSSDTKPIKRLLKKHGIRFGIVEEKLLLGFMKYASDPEKKFTVAIGRDPEPGKNAQIKYHFNTQYQRPGIVGEDGTIDFRDRGDIPFVKKGSLLAEKILLKKGTPGMDIFGEPIPVDEVKDLPLKAGNGAKITGDGLKVYAAIDGEPSLNANGIISVFKELNIKKNVDFETGHINFQGNVFVRGIIKEGFQVNCVDLTAGEIHGGIIHVSGNLNVSTGIIDAKVSAQGNIKAKFVNNSKIDALGDITITREIMESDIAVSGECINENGRITSSVIAAKKGFIIGQIGTIKASASTIKAGVDDHMIRLTAVFDAEIEKQQKLIDIIEFKKKQLENKNFEMHRKISDQSFIQETMMKKISSLRQQIASLKGQRTKMIKISKEIKKTEQAAKESDETIQNIFEIQDQIMQEISKYEKEIDSAANTLEIIKLEKKAMEEIAEFDEPVPVVRVNRKIFSGTRIVGPKSSMVVKHDLGACKIMEIDSSDPDDHEGRQMVIQNL